MIGLEIPESIITREIRIVKLREMANRAFFGFMKNSYLRDALHLENVQNNDLLKFLEYSNEGIVKTLKANRALISNQNINFVVAKESAALHRTYAKQLSGRIHPNGFLYLETDETNLFSSTALTSLFKGYINTMGESSVYAAETSNKFFGKRIPQKFVGSILEDGELEFKVTESCFDPNGSLYVSRIIADPFNGDGNKTAAYMENIEIIKNRLQEIRTFLLE
jgi:hypothetical protein